MVIRVGDIVELKRKYPYVTINNARGIVKDIKASKDCKKLYYIRIPFKYIQRSARNLVGDALITYENEIKEIK